MTTTEIYLRRVLQKIADEFGFEFEDDKISNIESFIQKLIRENKTNFENRTTPMFEINSKLDSEHPSDLINWLKNNRYRLATNEKRIISESFEFGMNFCESEMIGDLFFETYFNNLNNNQ